MKKHLLTLFILFIFSTGYAQKQISSFELFDVIDRKMIDLYDYTGENKGLVIIFVSHSCPYWDYYTTRFLALAKKYNGKGVKFVAINANSSKSPGDDAENMETVAKKEKWAFPYLADKNKLAVNKLKALKTPEVFVLKKTEESQFIIHYSGAIDDNPQVEGDVRTPYLKNAIESLLNGNQLQESKTQASGCRIK